jgi:hypothetical protein
MADAHSKGPRGNSPGAPSGCGHVGCDPDECWSPAPQPPRNSQKPKRRPVWVTKSQRVVSWTRCRQCKAKLWESWDADLMAGPVQVDAEVFLTTEGEARALVRGRRTWEYRLTPSRRIDFRDEWNRESHPAGQTSRFSSKATLVVVEHACGRPAPERFIYSPPKKPVVRGDGAPPF